MFNGNQDRVKMGAAIALAGGRRPRFFHRPTLEEKHYTMYDLRRFLWTEVDRSGNRARPAT